VLLTLSSAAVVWGAWGFARGIWAVAEQHRVDARVARRTRSQRVAGPIPQRVTRFGGPWPIAIEFVGGLAGWPGAGWLATGRILVGLPLLLIGPMIAWAIMPMLFSPFTGSFLSHTGWVSLLVWLAATATLSSLWLGIAMHRTTTRRQRAAIEPGRRRGRWQRRLIGAGAGLMVITLASALAIPAIVGVAQPANTQRRQPEIADEATGVYVKVGTATGVGYVSLFEWSFLLDAVPAETPIVGSDEIRSIVVADRGTVEPERYHMFALDSGRAVTFVASGGKAGESLVLSPTTTLRAGAYLIDVPNAGGWGRSYYYLVIASGTS
jgi:hypothetical protein